MRLNELPAEALASIAHLLKSDDNPTGIPADAVLPRATGHHVLCLQYKRPETITTASGAKFILPESSRREDEIQGRVGIVLELGPEAYISDPKFVAPWCEVGDAVAWPALENASARIPFFGGTLTCVPDDRVLLTKCDLKAMVGR